MTLTRSSRLIVIIALAISRTISGARPSEGSSAGRQVGPRDLIHPRDDWRHAALFLTEGKERQVLQQ
jgi:hypothetical protein